MTPRFDPTRAIIYDLTGGQLRDDEGVSRVNLPIHQLVRLLEQAGADSTADFGRGLGSDLGRRIASKLEKTSGIDAFTEHLGGHVALLGLGCLTVERWGKALVLRVAGVPEGAEALLGAVLEGALQRALGRQVATVAFASDKSTGYLVVSSATADRVRGLRSAGEGLGQVVEQLHRGAA
jgi:hypothetical protein